MSEYRRYNLTLMVADPSAREKFRRLSRPESFFEIRPNREPGERGAYSVEMTQDEYEAALEDAANPESNLIVIEPTGGGGPCAVVPDAATMTYVAAQEADSLGLTGKGITVGIIDSGLGEALQTGVFAGRVKAGKNYPMGDPFVDEVGHGSKMAGLAVPSGSQIVVAGTNYQNDEIAAALYWMADEIGVDIVNMSFRTEVATVLNDALSYAAGKNILLIAAAGNGGDDNTGEGEGFLTYPASHPSVYAISNYSPSTDSKAFTSNYGSYLWAAAPGSELYWYTPEGDTEYTNDGGTSAASAMTTGLAARFMTGGRSPGNVVSYLADNARPTGASPVYEGAGILQLAAAEQALQQDKPDKVDLAGNLMEGQDGTGNPDPGACG